jgi:hypothetical protein
MIEPTRMAATEKMKMGILIVPGACRFSSPINPPTESKITPKTIPMPFIMIEIIFLKTLLRVLSS